MHKKNLDSGIVKSLNVTKYHRKEVSSMATLTEKRVNFNSKLRIDHTGGELSTDARLVLVKELMTAFEFHRLSRATGLL